jgi:hypothetical protein
MNTELMEGSRIEVDADCTEDGPAGFYRELRRDLRRDCGDICNTTVPAHAFIGSDYASGLLRGLSKPVDCAALWASPRELEAQVDWPPPRSPPCPMALDFVEHLGAARREWVITWERGLEARANTAGQVWTAELIDDLVADIASGGRGGKSSYGREAVEDNLEACAFVGITGRRVLVVGSEWPWLEALLLHAGAAHVVTLEYRPITSLHPQVTTAAVWYSPRAERRATRAHTPLTCFGAMACCVGSVRVLGLPRALTIVLACPFFRQVTAVTFNDMRQQVLSGKAEAFDAVSGRPMITGPLWSV